MRHRGREFDMAHALAPHPRQRHLDAALLADDALVLHALVLAAQALVVLDRPEDAGAEQPIAFGLERAVVDGLRLLDLTVGPRQDFLRTGDRDPDLIEHLRRGLGAEEIDDFLIHQGLHLEALRRPAPAHFNLAICLAASPINPPRHAGRVGWGQRRGGLRPRRGRRNPTALLGGLRGAVGAAQRQLGIVQVDIEAEGAHLLHQHVEGLRDTSLECVVAPDDRLVHLGAAGDVVRLHGQHLLQRVSGAVGLERPHLHFAEALAAELRLAAQRLLGHEAVRADRAGMDLVVDKMVQLEHIDVTDRHFAIECFAGATVEKLHLARMIEASKIEHVLDIGFLRAVEDRGGDGYAMLEVGAKLDQAILVQGLDRLFIAVDLFQGVAQRLEVPAVVIGVDRLADAMAEAGAGPAQMGLEDLADIHAARHAERVEHDVDLLAVGQERHVLDRHDLGHDTFVAVAAGHLIAGLDLALYGDEDFDHLHHARRQFVAALQLFDLIKKTLLQALLRFIVLFANGLDLGHQLVVRRGEQPPLRARVFFQHRAGDLRLLLEALRTRNALPAFQQLGKPAIDVAVENGLLVVAVLGQPLDLLAFDGQRALVLVDAMTVENPHFDDGALDAGRHPQRGIADIGGLFAEDGAQEFFLGRHRAFTLRRYLANQDVAGVNFGADVHDAGFIEILQRLFGDVWNIAGDFLGAELGVAGHHLEFLDVNRGEYVVLDDALGKQNRVLEVVAVPGHEGDEDIAPERQLAEIGRWTVGDNVALL